MNPLKLMKFKKTLPFISNSSNNAYVRNDQKNSIVFQWKFPLNTQMQNFHWRNPYNNNNYLLNNYNKELINSIVRVPV